MYVEVREVSMMTWCLSWTLYDGEAQREGSTWQSNYAKILQEKEVRGIEVLGKGQCGDVEDDGSSVGNGLAGR